MQNIPESLWQSLKKQMFPTAIGDDERRLKTAFLYGMDAGVQATIKSTEFSNSDCAIFNQEMAQYLHDGIKDLGYNRIKLNLGKIKFD